MNNNKNLQNTFYIAMFLFITFCILTNSKQSLVYAGNGLTLWLDSMVPTLLPFMILSGTLVRMGLTDGFVTLVYPFIKPLFQISRSACYVMVMGFMCGFPMGAKCVDDMYSRGKISRDEATWLLAFCNNIGPVYFVSFALPLMGCKPLLPYVFGMYGLPLLYGLILRYTRFSSIGTGARLGQSALSMPAAAPMGLFKALNESIYASLQSILMLGGYMVFFNLLMLLPRLYAGKMLLYVAPLLEITGGLKLLSDKNPFYSLLALPFGGLSCIAQTYSCIGGRDLSIGEYVWHKLILTALTGIYYFFCLRFLRLW